MSRFKVLRWLTRFVPSRVTVTWRERLRSGGGALFGIALTGAVAHRLPGGDPSVPYLIAPMGASAVLLFGVPASPLAQPWSIIGGNLVSATVGVTAAMWIPDPVPAAAVAVAVAICAMFTLRCVHPPSGAVALTAVLGGPAVHALGYEFVFAPVALQSFLLLGGALVYHAATGHRYPHAARRPAKAAGPAPAQAGYARADLEAVLRDRDELLDIDTDDLETILHDAEIRAYARSFGELTCADVMSRNVVSIAAATTVGEARSLLRRYDVKALPVVDAQRRVKGIVTRADLADEGREHPPLRLVLYAVARAFRPRAAPAQHVAALMTTHVMTVAATTPIVELVRIFAGRGHHHVPVVDEQRRLAGIITQADLISGLYQQARTPQHEPA
ncbi:HPP family protein [Paraburkholderia lycopersici]|uniref:CBS domain-containing membrane protein n=1 Tax=Paraburkholderia lycopersici TaxID=416944 RepID=A0A1G6M4Z2_9BURK|nr:HPP family protein [Paraburkholderia lycopersici]SDC50035.1 CBS domain-containing membrane protein [Paraburkholderia lycopersici]